MELEIKGKKYQFKFGIGFLHEINKEVQQKVDGFDVKKQLGLKFRVAGIMDHDIDDLMRVLDVANMGQDPRLSKEILEEFIEDEDTDLEALFKEVLDFLSRANSTKFTYQAIQKEVEKAEQREKALENLLKLQNKK